MDRIPPNSSLDLSQTVYETPREARLVRAFLFSSCHRLTEGAAEGCDRDLIRFANVADLLLGDGVYLMGLIRWRLAGGSLERNSCGGVEECVEY